jgi:hypothetical protein
MGFTGLTSKPYHISAHVRIGSKAEVPPLNCDVRFPPKPTFIAAAGMSAKGQYQTSQPTNASKKTGVLDRRLPKANAKPRR